MGLETRSGHLQAGASQLHWECFEPGEPRSAPRVVLLHEGLGSIAQWRDFPQRLASALGEPVLAYSRRGYGRSSAYPGPWSARFMHDEALEQLPLVLKAFSIDAPILVGHSDGGSIALIHAASHANVRGLAVLAPHLFVEPISVSSIEQAREAFVHGKLAAGLARFHDDPDAVFKAWSGIWLDPQFAAWSIESEVARIACPVLAIQGSQDQYGTPRQVQRIAELVREHSVRVHLLDHCRHSPHLDQPDAVLALMTTFIKELP